VRLQRELSKTVVFVTHDVDEAITVAGQVAMLREGGVLAQVGTPTELLTSPVDEFVADFLGENRLVRLLGLRPLDELPLRPVDAEANGYRLTLEDGRAVEWRNGDGTAPAVPVFDGDTAKQVLEAALASPAGAVVRIDDRGAATGVISLDDLRLTDGGAPG
jgi:osmoprotectant transport system ATP-binding protein